MTQALFEFRPQNECTIRSAPTARRHRERIEKGRGDEVGVVVVVGGVGDRKPLCRKEE